MPPRNLYEKIYDLVRRIPPGRVATYGQIAALLKLSAGARQVGYALHALHEDSDVPWHRVVNAKGEISSRGEGGCEARQRRLLEEEGIAFDACGRIALDLDRWDGL